MARPRRRGTRSTAAQTRETSLTGPGCFLRSPRGSEARAGLSRGLGSFSLWSESLPATQPSSTTCPTNNLDRKAFSYGAAAGTEPGRVRASGSVRPGGSLRRRTQEDAPLCPAPPPKPRAHGPAGRGGRVGGTPGGSVWARGLCAEDRAHWSLEPRPEASCPEGQRGTPHGHRSSDGK